jgi:hypothetical protein
VGAALGAPLFTILWYIWGANWWAARSSDAAEARAVKLSEHVVRVHQLARNRPAMFAQGLWNLGELTFGAMVVVIGVVFWGNRYSPTWGGQPVTDFAFGRRLIGAALGMSFGYLWVVIALGKLALWIRPLKDIDGYTRQSRARIETLLTKAGVAEDVAAARLQEFDAKIEAAREEEIR